MINVVSITDSGMGYEARSSRTAETPHTEWGVVLVRSRPVEMCVCDTMARPAGQQLLQEQVGVQVPDSVVGNVVTRQCMVYVVTKDVPEGPRGDKAGLELTEST